MDLQQLGPYRIIGTLGRGGMGTVYEGVNLETGESAAIKLLAAAMAHHEGFRDRFAGEIETLRKLHHPNIVRLFGFGSQEDLLYYAMELVDGNSLETELGRGRRFTWQEAVQIGIETSRALRHAHDRGVIHRDIKPGNLLLAQDGHIKLSDFGIARLFGNTRMTHVGSVLGTAEYMAPEQADGRPVDPRADLYSLGAVLYVLLAGRPVFPGKSLAEVLHMQRFAEPEPLGRFAPGVPSELNDIVMQLLAKDPQRRVANATVLGRRLEAVRPLAPDASEASEPFEDVPGATVKSAVREVATGASQVLGDEPARTQPYQPDAGGFDPAKIDLASIQPRTVLATSVTPPAEDLPETRVSGTALESAAPSPPAAEPRKSPGQFIAVPREALDRPAPPAPKPSVISLQTWVLLAALMVSGTTVWYLLQPPSADALYDRISARTHEKTVDGLVQASGDIEQFLNDYPGDPRCHQLQEYRKEIELYRLERTFERRSKGLAATENLVPIERAYLEAINYARLDPERGMAKLQAILDLYGNRSDRAGPVGACLELARRRLEQLREQYGQQVKACLALVEDRLNQADALRKTDPARAEKMYRAVVELYATKPWAAAAAARAHAALDARERGKK